MFEEAVRASEAISHAAGAGAGALVPALSGCRSCGTLQMIAAPRLAACVGCGAPFEVLEPADTRPRAPDARRAA